MDIPGPCAICGKEGILHTCSICGRHVCGDHFVTSTGTCTICARRYEAGPAPATEPQGEPPNLPEPPPDAPGRLT